MANVKHLKVLGVGDPERLGNVEFVKQFITDMVHRVGMFPLNDPVIHDVPLDIKKLGREPFEDEGGVTGQILGHVTLSTSHVFMFVALHTWPLQSEFKLDLYSCRDFDKDEAEAFIFDSCRCTRFQSTDVSFAADWN
jgi:S-adenosylmethionine/arginine decarboxylase-like enzyme